MTWLKEDSDFEDIGIINMYIKSFYFVICTMSTIGYGDIVPVNTNEYAFIIFSSFIACGKNYLIKYTYNYYNYIIYKIIYRCICFSCKYCR